MIKLWCDNDTPPPDDSWRWFTDHWRALGVVVHEHVTGGKVDVLSVSAARTDWWSEIMTFFENVSSDEANKNIWPTFLDTH